MLPSPAWTAFESLRTHPVRLGDILEQVERKERVVADKSYRQLGVRWWGAGSFVREEKTGRKIKAKTLYQVSTGWIIYNASLRSGGRSLSSRLNKMGATLAANFRPSLRNRTLPMAS